MTVARSVTDVLTDHVVFEVECIDRMYLNVYVPQLRTGLGVRAIAAELGRSRRRPAGSCAVTAISMPFISNVTGTWITAE